MAGRLRDKVTLAEPRRRRRVAKLLRRMDRLDRQQRPRRPRAGAPRRRAIAVLTILALLIVGAWLAGASGQLDGDWPAAPADRSDGRLAPVVEVTHPADSFRISSTQARNDDPVTYDPCVPIHLVVNPRTIVDDGTQLLDEAIREIQEATGLVLTVDGLVDEPPREGRQTRTDDKSAWRPVLVAWSDPTEMPGLAGAVAGLGGSTWVSRGPHRWYVTGAVSLDGPQLAMMRARRGGRAAVRAVIMHELAHVLGLNHVDDPDELMQPKGRPGLTTWGPGDRTGLAKVGAGRCVDY